MMMRKSSKLLMLTICLLFERMVCDACTLVACLNCTAKSKCNACSFPPTRCQNNLTNCENTDFVVQVNTSSSIVQEGQNVTVTCESEMTPDLVTGVDWMVNQQLQPTHNQTLVIQALGQNVSVVCQLESECGSFFSKPLTICVNVTENGLMLILLCVCGAAALLIVFAIVMKIVQKRGQVQSEVRKRQRQQHIDNIHSGVSTVTNYY